jgi:hypothetical protein
LAGSFHAGATVNRTSSLPEPKEGPRAHLAGAKHRAVVALEYQWEFRESGRPPRSMRGCGTGVYMGTSADGKRGLILTAAHLFHADPDVEPRLVPGKIMAVFGPDLSASSAMKISVLKVVIHPDFKYLDSIPKAKGQRKVVNDLAILEFDAAEHGAGLTKAGFLSAGLYEGSGTKSGRPLEAEIVGFGQSGNHDGPVLASPGKIHAGNTYVTQGDWLGRPAFTHLSFLADGSRQAILDRRKGMLDANTFQFALQEADTALYRPSATGADPGEAKPLVVQKSHKNQAVTAMGDSGGPLFFNASGGRGLQVAGICSTMETLFLSERPCTTETKGSVGSRFCLLELWEPVAAHLEWIRKIQAGGEECKTALPENTP